MKRWRMTPEYFVPSFLQQVSGSRGEMDTGRGCEMIPNNECRELEGRLCLLLAAQQRCRDTRDSWNRSGKSSQTLQQLLFLILGREFPEHTSKL